MTDNARDETLANDLHDVVTHRAAWRSALIECRERSKSFTDDADESYWEHELKAFDRTFDKLATLLRAALPAPDTEDWRDDPSADERWNAGLDYGMVQLCKFLSVDPKSIRWDSATETLDGDVQDSISKILTARFGEDFDFRVAPPAPDTERSPTNDKPLHPTNGPFRWDPKHGNWVADLTAPDTGMRQALEACAKALYWSEYDWIESARERKWADLPEDDAPTGSFEEGGEPIIQNGREHYRRQCRVVTAALRASPPAPDMPVGERRAGHSKFVYNKATRTIDTVRTGPAPDTAIVFTDEMVIAAMGKIPGCDHDQMVDALQAALSVCGVKVK